MGQITTTKARSPDTRQPSAPGDGQSSVPPGRAGRAGVGRGSTYFPRAKHSSLAVAPLAVGTVSGNCTSILGSYSPITPVNKDKELSLSDAFKTLGGLFRSRWQLPPGTVGHDSPLTGSRSTRPAGVVAAVPVTATENGHRATPSAGVPFFMHSMPLLRNTFS